MLKSVFSSRVMKWIGYTLILSFLPIIISFILAPTYPYDFTLSNLANLYLAVCVLSVGILRDSSEITHPVSHTIQYLMILYCILSTVMFTRLFDKQGRNETLSPEETKYLLVMAITFLAPTVVIGICTQIYMEWRSLQSDGAE